MSRGTPRGRREESLTLFDLPLQEGPEVEETQESEQAEAADADLPSAGAADKSARLQSVTTSGLFEQLGDRRVDVGRVPTPRRAPVEERTAGFLERLRAGLADLAAIGLAIVAGIVASLLLGVPFSSSVWQPFAVLAVAFSFPYVAIPLAFWGQTPGMAWAGLASRTMGGEPLTFRQTALRWVGALSTTLLAGLPLLLALLEGGSLADRLSDSKTVHLADHEPKTPHEP